MYCERKGGKNDYNLTTVVIRPCYLNMFSQFCTDSCFKLKFGSVIYCVFLNEAYYIAWNFQTISLLLWLKHTEIFIEKLFNNSMSVECNEIFIEKLFHCCTAEMHLNVHNFVLNPTTLLLMKSRFKNIYYLWNFSAFVGCSEMFINKKEQKKEIHWW